MTPVPGAEPGTQRSDERGDGRRGNPPASAHPIGEYMELRVQAKQLLFTRQPTAEQTATAASYRRRFSKRNSYGGDRVLNAGELRNCAAVPVIFCPLDATICERAPETIKSRNAARDILSARCHQLRAPEVILFRSARNRHFYR